MPPDGVVLPAGDVLAVVFVLWGAAETLLDAPTGRPAAGLKALKLVGAGVLSGDCAANCGALWLPTL